MTNESKHTATPWYCHKIETSCGRAYRIGAGDMLTGGKGACIIYDDYPSQADSVEQANAAHIVKCVNAHDDLVKLMKSEIKYLRGVVALIERGKDAYLIEEVAKPFKTRARGLEKSLEAALKKSE